ncbi:unnamed protein product [Mytilus coruscus]|uniref:Uncharacterized protein n=1 Tax=Mytilus coruscus TaxID=42192 RepID=A0A6J8ETP0_MYTCO|nr:unnamed protein product [Mytilus coruscus]
MIEDVRGIVKVSAEKIFMYTIKAITDSLIEQIRKAKLYTTTGKENIRWVITVPAIWDDRSKLFMRQCAILAGLPQKQIFIALEPEAASIFCNNLKTERPENIEDGFIQPTPGTKNMVVDIGGGTTDITVHEKLGNGMLKQLRKSSGKGIGGTTVDKAFLEMIQKKLTGPVFTSLKNENPVVFLDLRKDLEEAKKSVTDEDSDILEIPMNYSAINSISKRQFNTSISKQITDIIVDENLQVDYATIKDLFKSTTDDVITIVEHALQFDGANEVSMILLVGGFSNCEIIEHAIRNRFDTKRVIVPVDASTAVKQGAVLYDHKPEVIYNRITKYTYGMGAQIPFDNKKT